MAPRLTKALVKRPISVSGASGTVCGQAKWALHGMEAKRSSVLSSRCLFVLRGALFWGPGV